MRPARIELYRDKAGEWRWSYRAANGRVMADGGEGYENRADAEAAAAKVTASDPDVEIVEVER